MEETVSLSTLTADDFDPLVESSFTLHDGSGVELPLTLASVRRANSNAARVNRAPFVLLFNSPPGRVLPQRIYAISHAKMGTLEIFIVPVGADADHVEYEAVFG